MERPQSNFSAGTSGHEVDFGALAISSTDSLAHRKDKFKAITIDSQTKRREEFLKRQKQAREDIAEKLRRVAYENIEAETLHYNTPHDSPEPQKEPVESIAPPMQVVNDKPVNIGSLELVSERRAPKSRDQVLQEFYSTQLQIPELMSEVPSDLAQKWFAVPIPIGKRCIVISARNTTTSRLRNGTVFQRWQSALPSGSAARGNKPEWYSILDCVYHEASMTYYVLDMMCWKGYQQCDCPTEFRFYWLREKLGETPAHERNEKNPYPFVPLPFYECSPEGVMAAGQAPMAFMRESVYFYHRDSHYSPGSTPLVVFLDITLLTTMLHQNQQHQHQQQLQQPQQMSG